MIWIAYLATAFSPILGWIGFALSLTINALGDTYLLTQARATPDGSSLFRRFARLYKNPQIALHGGLMAPAILIFVGLAAFGIGV